MNVLGTPNTPEAYQFFQDASVALCDIEEVGIKIDTKYLQEAMVETKRQIKEKTEEFFKETELGSIWSKKYKRTKSVSKDEQLSWILYEHMGIKVQYKTDKGKPKVDEKALNKMKFDVDGVKELLEIKKLDKGVNTYLKGIERETNERGFLHPSYSLNIPQTYRSSATDPNSQNWPIRNPTLGKLIRNCFIPRRNFYFGEGDYSGLEVHISACYNNDPNLIAYLLDETKDMHRDMAGECFFLRKEDITKKIRYTAKNGFVFPEFYGSYHGKVAVELWDMIDELDLSTVKDVILFDHLAKHGIKTLKQFTSHIKDVESRFWNDRFGVYTQWKEDFYKQYLKRGYFQSKTGFIYRGSLKRNQVVNYPIQGSAFHCLLWSAMEVNKELRRRKMRSRIIGQIHDAVLYNIHKNELEDVLYLTSDTSCNKLRQAWDWINIPLKMEWEVAPMGKSWYYKSEMPFCLKTGVIDYSKWEDNCAKKLEE